MPTKKQFVLLFILVFLFRLFFGLCHAMWTDLDEVQTYLIGLKCYATETWPYFGPDVNGSESSFQSQIPGALEGLMIGLPLRLLPIPEAPFIFLNLMSAAGVMLLSWYVCRRLPGLSFTWVSLWITVIPWSLQEATHIINPAYIFLPSILFFIGFLESSPFFRLNLIPLPLANALMGLSIFWVMQFHFSFVYLLPLAAFSLFTQLKENRRPGGIFYFLLGSLLPLAFLIPTYLQYGLSRNNVASGFAVPFNWKNVAAFGTILARYFSTASFELPRFIGLSTKDRVGFLLDHPLLFLPGALLWIGGLIQPFILFGGWFVNNSPKPRRGKRWKSGLFRIAAKFLDWFHRKNPGPQWTEMKWLVLSCLLMAEVSFWFTIKAPLSHLFFIFFPLLMIYSCYCWLLFAPQKHWRVLGKVFIAAGVFFQFGYAIVVEPRFSLYPERAAVQKAILEKNYHLMGERRPGSLY